MMDRDTVNRGLLRTLVWAGAIIFGLVLLWRFLAAVTTVVLLILLGVVLAVILSWPVEALRRLRVPRVVAAPLVVVGLLGTLLLVGYLFLPNLSQASTLLFSKLPGAISDLLSRVQQLLSTFGLNLNIGGGGGGFSLMGFVRQLTGGVMGLFSTLIFAIAGIVATIFLAVYLAARPAPIVGWVVRLFPAERRPRAWEVLEESYDTLLSWFKGQLVSMAIIGILSTVALYIIGVPGALILGILSGLLEFVPFVGPIVSAVPPTLLAFAGNPIEGVYVVVAYVIIQQLESNVVTPLVMRRAVEVHPATAIAMVTLLGTLFGLVGAFLAIPITVVGGVLVEQLWLRRLEEGSAKDHKRCGGENGAD